MDHFSHPLYVENAGGYLLLLLYNPNQCNAINVDKYQGSFCAQSVLPLPPGPGFPQPVRTELETEPQFCPRVHLSLTRPEYVVTFPHMARLARAPPVIPGTRGSEFAWSGPFHLLSQEGLRVVRDIVRREEHR